MKEIPLTQGKVALVDDAAFDWLNRWKWFAWKHRNTWYARRTGRAADGKRNGSGLLMHCEIAGILGVDHWDRNGLNNQRYNLRPATAAQNSYNKSPHLDLGIRWRPKSEKWQARISQFGKSISLGCFSEPNDARWAYILGSLNRFGQFSPYYRNFCNN